VVAFGGRVVIGESLLCFGLAAYVAFVSGWRVFLLALERGGGVEVVATSVSRFRFASERSSCADILSVLRMIDGRVYELTPSQSDVECVFREFRF
jgi:hypothetical protein